MCETRVVAADGQIAWLRRVIAWQRVMISEERRAVVQWKKLALLRGLELHRAERRRLEDADMPFLDETIGSRASAESPVAVGT